MEKIVEQGLLYDFYGGLLTGHQREIYEQVVYQDMSLAEIASEEGISKQAVSDLIKRATAQMQNFENQLGLIARFRTIHEVCEKLKVSAADGTASADTIIQLAEEIEKEL